MWSWVESYFNLVFDKKSSKPVLGLRHSLRYMLQNAELVPTNQTRKHSLLLAALKQNLPSYIHNLNTIINHIICVKFWGIRWYQMTHNFDIDNTSKIIAWINTKTFVGKFPRRKIGFYFPSYLETKVYIKQKLLERVVPRNAMEMRWNMFWWYSWNGSENIFKVNSNTCRINWSCSKQTLKTVRNWA